jgi:tetratricopeptide (TPR) repeat protein/DNA-binding winged helix-turn-helix (wHTH) protein
MRIVLHDRVIDLGNGQVQGGAALTQFECSFLRYLRAHMADTVSRDQLLVEVWGYPRPVPTRCVDTAVRRIRKKIEVDRANPRHLLTVQGEGYRWWDSGAVAVHDEDRCCGRARWSEQLAWAEATFGQSLDPHDPQVGLSEGIRTAFLEETAVLSSDGRAILDLLSLAQAGWTPSELARHADPAALRLLVHQRWAVVDGARARLGSLWWPVRGEGLGARSVAAELWKDRFERDLAVDLLEVLEACRWPQVAPEQAAKLLAVARESFRGAGLHRQLILACDALLKHELAPEDLVSMRLARAGALYFLGLFAEARREAESALAAAPAAPDLLGEALTRSAVLACISGDLSTAAERFGRAMEHTRDTAPYLYLFAKSEHAVVLWLQGHAEQGLEAARAALAESVIAGVEPARRHAEQILVRMLLGLGQHAQAMERMRPLYARQVEQGLLENAAALARYLGLAHLDLGQTDEGEVWLRRAREHSRADGDRLNQAKADTHLGCAAALRGEWPVAIAVHLRAISVFEDAQLKGHGLLPRCWVAVSSHKTGNASLSESMLQSCFGMLGENTSADFRSVLAIACEVLGVEGPASSSDWLFARIARRAWGLL